LTDVSEYMPLVHFIAWEMVKKLPPHIEFDDLVSAGALGLVRAGKDFRPEMGASFKTYCSKRIRGGMYDWLREYDDLSRYIRGRGAAYDHAVETLRRSLGEHPGDYMIQYFLGVDDKDYRRIVDDQIMTGLQSYHQTETDEGGHRAYLVARDYGEAAKERVVATSFMEQARTHMDWRERLLVDMYYYEGKSLRDIGLILGRSESRMCQVHSMLLDKLRKRLAS